MNQPKIDEIFSLFASDVLMTGYGDAVKEARQALLDLLLGLPELQDEEYEFTPGEITRNSFREQLRKSMTTAIAGEEQAT